MLAKAAARHSARCGGFRAVVSIVAGLREGVHEFFGHPDHQLTGRDVTDLGEGTGVEPEALDDVLAVVGVPQRG